VGIRKVISGGQTGADIAALRAARAAGIATGGWCPKGWRTEKGRQPELLKGFGLREHGSAGYAARTRANVEEAGCTIIIGDELDRGSKLTAEHCLNMTKPMLRVAQSRLDSKHELAKALTWLRSQPHALVNVAGNRESSSPGIEGEAEFFLRRLFAAIKSQEAALPAPA